ncbi:MAG: TIGR03016 family PEP-CTERM system-associated outer membrane protein [Gammaproteobacteria bacterium]|nr:TIGR03016 family PEP-CTERM system-associated outer membrane protein [Gammaproteobacteria bacterium]
MTQTRNLARLQLTLVLLLLCANSVNAGDWDITRSITVGANFSDNVSQDDGNKESDLVTEIRPAISVHGEGGRLKADIDYAMQNAIFVNNSDANGVFHQLDANATVELAKNLLFVDASSGMGQSIIDASDSVSTGNLGNTGNRTNFYTYSLSPYIQPHFGGYADGLFRYTHSEVALDRGASDSSIESLDAGLTSGRNFGPFSWSANYNYSDQQRSTASNAKFENSNAQARYRISRRFSLVGSAGYSSNEFESSRDVVNGSYWSAGVFLQPSRYYSLEAQQGNNLKTATVSLYPTRRTSMLATYSDQSVGLNPGEVWSGSLSHYTRRTTWSASYREDTTTQQQLFLEPGGFVIIGVDPLTGLGRDPPQPGDLLVPAPFPPFLTLTDEVVERKRASGTFGMKMGKTGLRLTVFDERTLFLTSLIENETKGLSGSLDRRLAPRTNGILSGSYQRIADADIGNDLVDIFMYVQAEVTRQMSKKSNASVSYRFTMRDSNDNNRDSNENRITAKLRYFF